jgi:hypothetical protein
VRVDEGVGSWDGAGGGGQAKAADRRLRLLP